MMCLIALLVCLPLQEAEPRNLVITNVTVIDVLASTRLSKRAVTIAKGRILSIRDTAEVAPGADDQVVDGTGAYLIPGLWDMHAEIVSHAERDFALMLANGVTGVRSMLGGAGATLDDVLALREGIEAGRLVGPRIAAGGLVIGSGAPRGPRVRTPRHAAEARVAVRGMHASGADFVEIRESIGRDVYFAIVEEARGLKLRIAGLVPWHVTSAEASRAGQDCIEGLFKVPLGCCDQEHKVTARFVDYYQAREQGRQDTARLWSYFLEGFNSTFEAARRDDLITTFARNRTWHCPLLLVNRFYVEPEAFAFQPDETHDYVPSSLGGDWQDKRGALRLAFSSANPKDNQVYFQRKLDLVRDLQRSGVGILAGSGLGRPYVVAGFGLHAELAMLVDAGLTPAQALRTATLAAATFLGREAELGSVEEGKLADLVLLDADPLVDIKGTRAIRAVVVGGRILEREALDELLSEARRLAAR